MKKGTICVIIPIYKKQFSVGEELTVLRNVDVLKNRDIFFVAPIKLDCSYYQNLFPDISIKFYSRGYFRNNCTYSKLLLNPKFYREFIEYEYMLIAQSDAIIMSGRDRLDYFVEKDYDYWGAPWSKMEQLLPVTFRGSQLINFITHPVNGQVGNGGFCLRKVSTMLEITMEHKIAFFISSFHKNLHEDNLLSCYVVKDERYRMPNVEEAAEFALEKTAFTEIVEKNKKTFGIHAYEKYLGNYEYVKQFFYE